MIAVGGKMTVFRFIKTKKKHLPSSGEEGSTFNGDFESCYGTDSKTNPKPEIVACSMLHMR